MGNKKTARSGKIATAARKPKTTNKGPVIANVGIGLTVDQANDISQEFAAKFMKNMEANAQAGYITNELGTGFYHITTNMLVEILADYVIKPEAESNEGTSEAIKPSPKLPKTAPKAKRKSG